MRKIILNMIFVMSILLIVLHLGAGITSWEYWAVVLLTGAMGTNSVIDG